MTDLWPLCRYTLANIESRKGVRQGDKVFQVGFGGGTLPTHATTDMPPVRLCAFLADGH